MFTKTTELIHKAETGVSDWLYSILCTGGSSITAPTFYNNNIPDYSVPCAAIYLGVKYVSDKHISHWLLMHQITP